jgi:hypothetical protein
MLPLGEEIIDAIDPYHNLHLGRHAGIRIVGIRVREQGAVAGQGHEGSQLCAHRVPHAPDPRGIDLECRRLAPEKLHGGAGVMDGCRIAVLVILHEAIVDGKQHIAMVRQIRAPGLVFFRRPELPAPAMDSH